MGGKLPSTMLIKGYGVQIDHSLLVVPGMSCQLTRMGDQLLPRMLTQDLSGIRKYQDGLKLKPVLSKFRLD